MTNENITPGTAGEVTARFEDLMIKLRKINTEIYPLQPEAERLRPSVKRAETFIFEAGARLDTIFATQHPDITAAFEILTQLEAAIDQLDASVEAERGRNVGPMEAV